MSRGTRPFRSLVVGALALGVLPQVAMAASCNSCATVVSAIFQKYRAVSEALGCKTPQKGHGEFLACAGTRLFNETLDDMVGWWNTGAKNRWPTIGPRMLGAEVEVGTVIAPTKRTFVSMVPSFNNGKIIVTPKAGKGKVTICAVDPEGGKYKLYDDVMVSSRRAFSIGRKDAEGRVLAVVLKSSGVRFQYEIEKQETPLQWNFGAIQGLADLHLHGAAQLGFAGLWTWGENDGIQSEALKSCRALNVVDGLQAVNLIGSLPLGEKKKLHAIPTNHNKHDKEEVVRHGAGWEKNKANYTAWPHFSDIGHQQVHTDWLKEAHDKGLRLVVMCAVNNELLCRLLKTTLYPGKNKWACDDMSNLKRQLEGFNELDRKYDWFEVALTPWHARKIIHEGKLAVVLSAESSHMLPRSEGDFVAQLDKLHQLGLRSLQIVHERDNRFAGAAPHRKNFNWHQRTSNPVTWLSTMGDGSPFALDARGKNKKGLTKEGERLIDAMVQRRMLIDVSHYSERTFDDVHQRVTTNHGGYPLYASHTRFRPLLDEEGKGLLKEFCTTPSQVEKLKAVGGMVGIRTGPTHVKTHAASGVENDCPGTSKSYAQLVSFAAAKGIDVAFGSDFNGVTQQMGPRRGKDECYAATQARTLPWSEQPALPGVPSRFQTQGLRHIGYLPDLYTELKALGTNGAERLNQGAEKFVKMWEKTYGPPTSSPGSAGPAQPARVVNRAAECQKGSCPSGQFCDVGVDLTRNVCRPKKNDGTACALADGGRTCKSGRCKSGRCFTPSSTDIGGTCWVNDACRSGKCSSPVDGTRGTCVCKKDPDCGAGFWCDKGLDFSKNKCKPKLKKGQVCGTVGELGVGHRCKSGNCKVSGISTKLKCK